MSRHTATATREGRWWVIDVPSVDGVTQARRLADAEQMARELVAVTTGEPVADVEVSVEVAQVGKVDVGAALAEIHRERAEAERLERDAATRSRGLATALVDAAVPLRDVGAILGVSHQRAHQLVNGSTSIASGKSTRMVSRGGTRLEVKKAQRAVQRARLVESEETTRQR